MKIFLIIILALFITGCVKSVASDKHFYTNRSFHARSWGTSARELLSDSAYRSMTVEVQYMEGFEPDEEALNHLRNFMLKHLNKPDGITILKRKIDSSRHLVSTQKIIEIENANRKEFTNGSTITMYILYVNNAHIDTSQLGIAYRNTSMAIFGKPIKENSGSFGKPGRTQLEASVLLHEMGHLLGLVGKNDKTHNDKDHPGHCRNKHCLMYYGIEVEDKFSLLRVKAKLPTLDASCLARLKALGSRNTKKTYRK